MVKVEFLGPIDKEAIEIEAFTLRDVSQHLKKDVLLKEWLSKCTVAVNDVIANDIDMKLNDGDKISILPPVCGG